MKVDVIIADEGDRAHVVHLLECPEHGQEFVDELLQLLMKAAASPELPAVAMFISMELFHDRDDVNNITATHGQVITPADWVCRVCGCTQEHACAEGCS